MQKNKNSGMNNDGQIAIDTFIKTILIIIGFVIACVIIYLIYKAISASVS
jgi:hypothetical protein